MSGLQISDMTDSLTVFPDGAFVPLVVETNTGGLVTTTNYRYNAGLYLAKLSTLAANGGAALIGTSDSITVQAALDARPTLSVLAASDGASLIGYIASGTGAVATTVQDKLRQIISPLDFGASGDGATNDASALNLALAQAIATGKPLDLLGLTYGLTAPGAASVILPLTAGVTVRNGTLKILNPTSGYAAIIGSTDSGVDLSGLLIDGVTFDQAMDGVTPAVSTGLLTYTRDCVKAKRGDGITVRNCTFLEALGTNTIELNGDGNTANCTIEGNTFRLAEPNIATSYFDSSTLYVTGDGIKVTSNRFIGASLGSVNGTCAIEVHPGSIYEVSGNTITAVHTGINIAGIYDTDSTVGICEGNSLEVLRRGIAIYSATHSTHLTGYGIDGLNIDGNYVRVRNQLAWSYSGGGLGCIGIGIVAGSSLATRNINIDDGNQIIFDLEATTPDWTDLPYGAGIGDTSGTIVHENFRIGACLIQNAPLFGVALGLGGGVLKNLNVGGVNIVNPGSTAKANGGGGIASIDYRAGFYIRPNSISGSFDIAGAVITDDLATSRIRHGAVVSCINAVTAPVDIGFDLYVTGGTTTAVGETILKFDNNIVPKVSIGYNLGVPTYEAGDTFQWGSTLYDRLNGVTWQMFTTSGTLFTRITPLYATATWDPGNLADGAGETSAGVTVTGAAFGDFVQVSAPYDLQGILLTAYVSAADTVKARLQNETGGAIDLASGTYRFRVTKQQS